MNTQRSRSAAEARRTRRGPRDIRRAVPYALLPLALVACMLASAPWLRAFPSDVIAVPLFGAAALSVLAPVVTVGVGVRRLWVGALIDVLLFVFYELLVALREPVGFADLYSGIVHGPSQILSFALPLVSPRTLLVAPVALCWLAGAVVGECIARGWQTVLPYVTVLATFGLTYAGTARAITSSTDGRRYDTLLGGVLLLVLLLLRTAQAWVSQNESSDSTQPDGVLPLRGLAVGAAVAVGIAAAAAGAVQASSFAGQPATPARVPPLDQSHPLTPIAFVGELRPTNPRSPGQELFKVSVDRATSNYVALANVDYYDGDSWSFSRTFRPSGGVIPADPDPAMRPPGPPVTQQYTIARGAMTSVPWMPHLDRVEQVTGVSVDIDGTSGMVVPAGAFRSADAYSVVSSVTMRNFMQLGRTALVGTSAAQVDTSLANGLAAPLGALVGSLAQETGTSSDAPIPFLQAVTRDFRAHAGLAGAPPTSLPSQSRSASPSASPTPSAHTGGTTFADVLASIRGSHSGTPEQFATLTALLARRLGVPARVVTGFRVPPAQGETTLAAGTYHVTTADAWTWVEIPVRGLGWVVLDPSPGTYAGQTPSNVAASPSVSPSPRPSQNAQLTHSNNGGHAVAPSSRTPHATGMSVGELIGIVLVSLWFALTLVLVVLLARKGLRARRRRRLTDPRHRLLGAWHESLDLLVESGVPDLTYATSAEIVASTRARFGPEPAAEMDFLGTAANVAIFSPAAAVGDAQAEAAWRAQVALSRAVRRRLGWRERLGARLRYNRPRSRRTPINVGDDRG